MKSKTLLLVHPKFGICAQESVKTPYDEVLAKKKWRHKYGLIIEQCEFELLGDAEGPEMVIKNTRNGHIYESKEEAMSELGLGRDRINKILARQCSFGYDYYLEFRQKEAV